MPEPDYCNRRGAEKLTMMIRDYWAKRGATVTLHLIDVGFVAAMRGARVDVRSDLVNGLPRSAEQGS